MEKVMFLISLVLLGVTFSLLVISVDEYHRLQEYKEYASSTEALLDSLEQEYNWSDRFDGQVVDNYVTNKQYVFQNYNAAE